MSLQDIFSTVLNMSLTGSVVICFVMVVRFLLQKAPKVFSYALWAVVLFRLLCPVSISSALSLLNFTKATVSGSDGIVTAVEYAPVLDIYQYSHPPVDTEEDLPHVQNSEIEVETNTSIPDNRTEVTPTSDAANQQAPAEPVREPIYYTAYIWLVGIGVMLIYNIYSYRKLGKKIVGAVRLRNNIYLADHIPSPFVLGVIHPRIYLPSVLEASERTYIIAHERYHIRRKDHVIKLLAYAALCIHWFNPLVWVAFTLSGKDMEMSCDEAVIGKLGPNIRADYSASLLRLATGHRIIAGTPLAFGEGDTKGRVLNMAKWKKPRFWVVICAAIVCIGVLVACAMNPTEENRQAEDNETTSPNGEMQAPLWSTEMDPEEACQKAIDELKSCNSYYIQYEYSSAPFEEVGGMEYRRYGNDLLVENTADDLLGSTIYFEGVRGMHYGDYWAMEEEKSEYDPNAWLTRWAPEEKEISNVQLVNNTIVFEAVWPHQRHPEVKYQGTFTYTFNADGSLASVQREYVSLENGEATSATTDKITVMEENPDDTYAAIKAVANQSISVSELEHYRIYENIVDEIPSNKSNYDLDLDLGAVQMRWRFPNSGWQFVLGAENAASTSVTLFHTESGNDHTSLLANEGFWLEKLVDGKWRYVDEAITKVGSEEVSVTVSQNQTDRYHLDWSDSYGALEPGFYRVGRYYTVTMNSGGSETTACYAKFRIMDDNTEILLKKCRNAFDSLLSSSYHVYVTNWRTHHDSSYYIASEVWKHGSDYLSETRYIDRKDPGILEGRNGAMMRDGLTYSVEWSGDEVTSPIASWQYNTYMDETNFILWSFSFEWYDSLIEEVVQSGNQITIVEKFDFNELYENMEITLTFDNDGNLTAMCLAYLPTRNCAEKDKVIDAEMIIQDTSKAEIAKVIDSQDLSKPLSFSYQQDVADHPNAQTSGFVNTMAQTISGMEDALKIAARECTLKPQNGISDEGYNMTKVHYDANAKMWKVEFMHSASDSVYQAIYLNGQGITQMIVSK